MPVRHEIKSQLARLLATEDLIVEHKQVKTAQFNVHTRELILPLWERASNNVYDTLVAHEVGHALFTPDEDWSQEVQVPQQFMNVVEDVRIEKLIKRKYMGLNKTFYKGYEELNAKDFFEIEDEDITTFNLADRINLYFKVGSFVDVSFTDREKEIVDLVSACETFDDVKNASQVLYDYCKEEADQQDEQLSQEQIDDIQSELDSDSSEGQQDSEGESDSQQITEDTGASSKSSKSDDIDIPDDEPEVRTERSLSEQLKNLVNQSAGENVYLERPDLMIEDVIASNEDVHKEIDYSFSSQEVMWEERRDTYPETPSLFGEVDSEYLKFKKDAQKEVNYLVKEFECKKAASAYARATTSRTGVLDTAKLQTYKFNEDLFKKISILPDGKNHGLIFILDWSGSMAPVLQDTVKQLFNLVWFCKKVQIPFEVYAFTNEWRRSSTDYETGNVSAVECTPRYHAKEYTLRVEDDFSLMNLLTSRVRSKEFDHQLLNIWRLSSLYSRNYNNHYYYTNHRYQSPHRLSLSGTPLNETLLSLHKIIPQFKTKSGVEKVQCIVLTDGEANMTPYHLEVQRRWEYEPHLGCRNINSDLCSLRDRKLGKTYRFGWNYADFTSALVRNLKDNFPSTNFIGIRVLPPRDAKHFIKRYHSEFDKEYEGIMKDWKKSKSFTIKSSGYDAYFGMSSANLADDVEFDVNEDASKAEIKRAFAKSLKTKKLNKKILGEFVSLVC